MLALACFKRHHVILRMQAFVARLHANGQRWVPILDPGIHIRSGYHAYDSGMAQDVFLRDISGGYYMGQVSPSWLSAGILCRAVVRG